MNVRGYAAAVVAWAVLMTGQSCNLNPPGDKTPANPVPTPVVVMLELVSEPSNIWANVTVNARDHSGLPAVDLVTQELYPTVHAQRTPYRHLISHLPHVTVTYSMEAYVGGEVGTILGCAIYIDGVKLQEIGTPHVMEIAEGSNSTLVYCEYTRYAVKGA